ADASNRRIPNDIISANYDRISRQPAGDIFGILIASNKIVAGASTGIIVRKALQSAIVGNVVDAAAAINGISVGDLEGIAIVGNEVYGGAKDGILLTSSTGQNTSQCLVASNQCSGSQFQSGIKLAAAAAGTTN